ncbi:hypothetical protein B0I26_1224 [Anoxybacillus vitaminiphilus]|jgi:hypothetical protein|uniref:Uncharacterized protein n=2 Tax=Paranoxybacillus vitaminiphilus TaxID=581036 RepID=A0A327Y3J0_9BACL|nr:hypothetical protein B0I26_1224 [Anoxybacillus vitaminiphilus]
MCQEEEKEMNSTLDRKREKQKLNIDSEKFKAKVPRLSVVDGRVQIDPNNPLHRKWFEEFKK